MRINLVNIMKLVRWLFSLWVGARPSSHSSTRPSSKFTSTWPFAHGRLNHVVLCLVWSFLPKPVGQNHTLRRSGLFSPVAGQKRKYWCFSSIWIYHSDDILQFSNLVCPSTRILSPESEQKVFIDKHHVKSSGSVDRLNHRQLDLIFTSENAVFCGSIDPQ